MLLFILSLILILLLIIIGWLIPSFIGVLLYRKWPDLTKALSGWKSYCNNCWKELKLYNVIPIISYIIQNWKCKYCWYKIPFRYFIYELISWIVFTLIIILTLIFLKIIII